MIDAVLDVHMRPLSCGVSKYNVQLARRLGVPLVPVREWVMNRMPFQHPLLSAHAHELREDPYVIAKLSMETRPFSVLWHDAGSQGITSTAHAVYWARELGAPSTIDGNPTRGTIDVLTFGMSHRFQGAQFDRLRHLLEQTHEDYTVSLSTGIHEGTPWEAGFQQNVDLMREIFGSHLRTLGFVMDDGLARLLLHTNLCALFYEPAVRANNTTFWAAVDAGVPVITNLDQDSPQELQHEVSVYDLAQLDAFPLEAARHREVRAGARQAARSYGWDRIIAALQAPVHA